MKEQKFKTHIGDEVEVTVWFDYEPFQPQTRTDPEFMAQVTINAVLIDEDDDQDIADILKKDIIEHLKEKCFGYLEEQSPN